MPHELNADSGRCCCYCRSCSAGNKADVESGSSSSRGIFDNRTTHLRGNRLVTVRWLKHYQPQELPTVWTVSTEWERLLLKIIMVDYVAVILGDYAVFAGDVLFIVVD